jgi:hypothetical protein
MGKDPRIYESHDVQDCRHVNRQVNMIMATTVGSRSKRDVSNVSLYRSNQPGVTILDTGSKWHVFNKNSGVIRVFNNRVKFNTVNGRGVCDNMAFHPIFGTGLYIPESEVTCISSSALENSGDFKILYIGGNDSHFEVEHLKSGTKFNAYQEGGVYVLKEVAPEGVVASTNDVAVSQQLPPHYATTMDDIKALLLGIQGNLSEEDQISF